MPQCSSRACKGSGLRILQTPDGTEKNERDHPGRRGASDLHRPALPCATSDPSATLIMAHCLRFGRMMKDILENKASEIGIETWYLPCTFRLRVCRCLLSPDVYCPLLTPWRFGLTWHKPHPISWAAKTSTLLRFRQCRHLHCPTEWVLVSVSLQVS